MCQLIFVFLLLLSLFNSTNFLFTNSNFRLGLENVNEKTLKGIDLKKETFGLITNHTGKDSFGNRNVDLLVKNKCFNIKAIFVPEHGLEGAILAGKNVDNTVDKKTGIKIVSLYRNGNFKAPDEEDLNGITTLIFDIQDCGMRHYTYVSTLFRVLEVSSFLDKKIMVLDRPNPLGLPMEGPLVEARLISFISVAPIPLRHGMTIGELAIYFNKYFFKNRIQLSVIPMANYNRTTGIKGKLITPLSPNIKSLDSCFGYSFLGLLGEIKPFDVGVGTDKAFQAILLSKKKKFPLKKWMELRKILEGYNIKCDNRLYTHFNAKKNKYFEGQVFRVKDINNFQCINTLLSVLNFFKRSNIRLSFSKAFDKAIGTAKFRDFFEGRLQKDRLVVQINKDLRNFYKKAISCFLYFPAPKIIDIK